MKNISLSFIIIILVFSLSSCKHKTSIKEYYVVSTGNYTNFSNIDIDKNNHHCQEKVIIDNLFTKLVILLDSTDIVYLYQTETIKDKLRGCVRSSDEKYQDFIGLKPEHLIKFNSKDFMSFIKNNNDIFHLDTISKFISVVIVASNKDTIMNPAYYDFINYVTTTTNKPHSNVRYTVRKTTEEENNVMYCKRNNINYNWENYKWSDKSIISKFKPFTKQYDSLENVLYSNIVRACITYKKDTVCTFTFIK